jgi:hypothetical protein
MHGSEPFDFTRKKNPDFEKSLPRPYKEIADLPRKHDRMRRSIDVLITNTRGISTQLMPGFLEIVVEFVNQLCFSYIPVIVKFRGRSSFSWGFGLFRSRRSVGTSCSRPHISCPPGLPRRRNRLENWLGGLDSNQDNQIQNLMYCQLYDLPAEGSRQQKRAVGTTLNYFTDGTYFRQQPGSPQISRANPTRPLRSRTARKIDILIAAFQNPSHSIV